MFISGYTHHGCAQPVVAIICQRKLYTASLVDAIDAGVRIKCLQTYLSDELQHSLSEALQEKRSD